MTTTRLGARALAAAASGVLVRVALLEGAGGFAMRYLAAR